VAQPDYIRTLSDDISAVEESTLVARDLKNAKTVADVRRVLEAHRQFYLSMEFATRAAFNEKIKRLFEVLP
jgi:hypothetical protein